LDLTTRTIVCIGLIVFAGCDRTEKTISGPLKQRGYVWQREWTPAVIEAVGEAGRKMDGVVLLGGEIHFAGRKPEIIKASIDWEAVKRTNHCAIALRVSPFAGPFRTDNAVAHVIVDLAKELMNESRIHGVELEEFQFDFDCARKNLSAYRAWLQMLKPAVHPTRFVITALPAWLDDSQFRRLVRETDGFVLQVHSVPLSSTGSATLCDPRLARQWIDRTAKLGVPFSVALPTYRCTAGYGPEGKLLSVAMDSVQPIWPPGTRVLEFGSNADELAALVNDLLRTRPAMLRELIWYRVPIATDTRNWQWITLAAVMAGRHPEHKLNVVQDGENPIDLSILNAGEADEQFKSDVTATWNDAGLTASDALSGWNVRSENGRAIFSAAADRGVRLPPGASRKIGWLRFDQPTTTLRVEISNQSESLR
jgi:Protein of unknown function (DUF3142)